MKKCFRVTTAPLLIGTMLIGSLIAAFASSAAPAAAQTTIPRENTVWMSGYWPAQTQFNPIFESQGMDTYFMYEPMFGLNIVTGELIKILGDSIQWVDNTTIEVTLRDGTYWTDRSPIKAEDVKYTYYLQGAFTDSPRGWGTGAGSIAARVGASNNFEIMDDKTFRVHIKENYPNSEVVYRLLTQSFLIVPKHVWEDIVAAYPTNGTAFLNDWLSTIQPVPTGWKVASGMYLPYWHDASTTYMQRNDDWWGKEEFGRLPAPLYLANVTDQGNVVAAAAVIKGDYDWDSNFVAGLQNLMQEYPHIHTYFANPPYFPDKSTLLLVPNHRKYPLNENWLRKAIAMALDDNAINLVSSGYLKTPSPMLIPADDTVARTLLNTDIEAQYAVNFDPDAAIALLAEHCYLIDSGGNIIANPTKADLANGTWYTKDGPSQEWLDLYGSDAIVPSDALSDVDGLNVRLGPYEILDISGWTDVNAIDMVAAKAMENIGIPTSVSFVTWYSAQMQSFTFDFVDYCMHMGLNSTMYERYYQMFTGNDYMYNHYGDYRNPTLVSLLDQLDTKPAGSAEQHAIADQIQTIIGQDMPLIPMAGHPDWYIYSTMYWEGWPNAETNPLLPVSVYGGGGNNAQLQKLVFGLYPASPTTTTPATEGAPWVWAGVGIAIVVVIAAVALVLMRKK